MGRSAQQGLNFIRIDPDFERTLLRDGYKYICGVDEAGRGPLAGPVVAAAVIFKECTVLGKCRDSKQLTKLKREELFDEILNELQVGIGQCSPQEIDELNIRQASLEAMRRAVTDLQIQPDILLVDGRDAVPMNIKSLPMIKGDARISVISAASIVAKVTRDRLMIDYDKEYPMYGLSQHFGYPTLKHREAIKLYGPCPIHRKSFRGVREYI